MTNKVLFLGNDLGGGLGHVRRCGRLADILHKQGWDTAFNIHLSKSKNFIQTPHKIFYAPFAFDQYLVKIIAKIKPIHNYPINHLNTKPFFWEFAGCDYQVLRDGFFTDQITRRRFNKISSVINKWKPDLIIGDGHLLSYFLGSFFQIPTIQIVRYAIFPENTKFLWWKNKQEMLRMPQTLPAFRPLFDLIKQTPFEGGCKVFTGNAYLIPGTPNIEPIDTNKPHLFYGYHVDSVWDERLIKIDKKKRFKKIFITIGGGAQRSNVEKFYKFLLQSIKKLDVHVIFSDPFEILKGELKKENYPNISVFKWIETSTVFPYLDLIIHHGGYSTTMEALWWGIPSIIIPFHSEQEGNGRRIEKLKAGKVLLPSHPPYHKIDFKSRYGLYNMMAGFDFDLTENELIQTIEKISNSKDYKKSVMEQSDSLKSTYNPHAINDFVTKQV